MRRAAGRGLLSTAAVAMALLLLVLRAAAAPPELSEDDCAKCHPGPPAILAAAGAAHRDVGCFGCHPEHRPRSLMTSVPRCVGCHSGEDHYHKAEGCAGCHRDPHAPLSIPVVAGDNEPCRECHPSPVALIARGGSAHSDFDCAECHTAHREVPSCLDCHEPHASGMETGECLLCHQPHLPVPVTYGYNVSNEECGVCHDRPLRLLSASRAKHRTRLCVACHQRKHGTLITCRQCHGEPHGTGRTGRAYECGDCHNVAHDLNNLSATARRESPLIIPDGLRVYLEEGRKERLDAGR